MDTPKVSIVSFSVHNNKNGQGLQLAKIAFTESADPLHHHRNPYCISS